MNEKKEQSVSRGIRMAFRYRAVRLLLLVLVFVLPTIFLASGPENIDPLGRAIGGRGYSLVSWELRHFLDKWTHEFTSLFGFGDGSDEERLADVQEYFRLNAEIAAIDGEIERAVSTDQGDLSLSVAHRQELDRQRDRLQTDVEKTIEGQISRVLSEQGLSWKLPFGGADGYLFPPVDFRFDDSPRVLAVSPRERIELTATRLLEPGIRLEDIEGIERGVEEGGELSALVTGAGGVATFPSVIPQSSSLRHTLRTITHEWVHHYMVFFPLGWNYWNTADMITINETIADVIGNEVGDMVYDAYYAELMPEPSENGAPVVDGGQFDFVMEMRETRSRADELLAQGEIEEAERYLEERRVFFSENGYFFRKLNQAYFAFQGTYADDPAVVSPIGDQVIELRGLSATLKEFIETVSGLDAYGELLELLGE